MRGKKKLLGIILSLVLVLGLMPVMSMTAHATTYEDYFSEVTNLNQSFVNAGICDQTTGLKCKGLSEDTARAACNYLKSKTGSKVAVVYGCTIRDNPGWSRITVMVDGTPKDSTYMDAPITAAVGNDCRLFYVSTDAPEFDIVNSIVTFKVVDGTWDDGTAVDKTVTLTGQPGDTLELMVDQIPSVGSKPDVGYKEGSWDITPTPGTAPTEDVTFTYTYVRDISGESSGGSSDSGSTSGGSTDSGSSSGSSSSSSTSTSTPAPATVPYDKVVISTGAVNDITGTAAATAEKNPFGTKIENNDNLTTLLELTPQEVAQGVNVWLDIQDMSATVPQAEKDVVQSASANFTVGIYLDINLFKKVGGNAATKITETNGPVKASILIPESLWKAGRTFEIIRVHDGVPTVISGTYDENTHVFTFETDKFSTYALAYNDSANSTQSTAPKTGDDSDIMVWYLLLAVSLGGLSFLGYSKKRKVNKILYKR